MNPVFETIQNRRSIREFNGRPISEEILSEIVEAGRWAPTGGNSQSVHFLVLCRPSVLKELQGRVKTAFSQMDLTEDLYFSIQNSIRKSRAGDYTYDYHAQVLVVAANRKGYPNAMADSACALQNMMLMACSLGVGSCWINQLHWLDENPLIREYLEPLGLQPEETICGSAAFGYYDGSDPPPPPRTGMKVDYLR